MSDTQTVQTSNRGVGFLGWLALILVLLKLNPGGYLDSAVQDWPWWLVLMPLWIGFAIALVILVVALCVWFFSEQLDDYRRKKRLKKYHKNLEENRKRAKERYQAQLNKGPKG